MQKEILLVRALLSWVCSGHFVIHCEMRLSVQLSVLSLGLLFGRKLSAIFCVPCNVVCVIKECCFVLLSQAHIT